MAQIHYRRFLFCFLLIFIFNCQALHQLSNPIEFDGHAAPVLVYHDAFTVLYDPAIGSAQLQRNLERGYHEWVTLKKYFFPAVEKRIHLVLYKDRLSYDQHAPNLPKSLARYNRQTNRIHVVVEVKRSAWRHEMIHAMLDGQRRSSFRVQEGLAWFLAHQQFGGNASCSPSTAARSVPFGPVLAELRRSQAPSLDQFFFAHHHSMKDIHFIARSAYYMQFLWQKKALQSSLRYYLQYPNSAFEFELTRGDRVRLKRLYEQFNQWLRGRGPTKVSRGC